MILGTLGTCIFFVSIPNFANTNGGGMLNVKIDREFIMNDTQNEGPE